MSLGVLKCFGGGAGATLTAPGTAFAVMEFTPEGPIIAANPPFCATLGDMLAEIKSLLRLISGFKAGGAEAAAQPAFKAKPQLMVLRNPDPKAAPGRCDAQMINLPLAGP